jgi:hypothetical protein
MEASGVEPSDFYSLVQLEYEKEFRNPLLMQAQ